MFFLVHNLLLVVRPVSECKIQTDSEGACLWIIATVDTV